FFKGAEVLSLLPSTNGKIWIATSDGEYGSVYQCSGMEKNDLKQLSKKATIAGLSWPGFRGNSQQGFWAIHSGKGLFNISENGEVKYYPSALNPNADMSAFFADREHNLWIANDPGLIKMSNL